MSEDAPAPSELAPPTSADPLALTPSSRWNAAASWCVRRAGLSRLCEKTRGSVRTTIAVIDGLIETQHSSLQGARIEIADVDRGGTTRPSVAAAEHATFIASILVGNGPHALGLCPQCRILNIPAVDADMLSGRISSRTSARRLAGAIDLAVRNGANLIQISLDLGFGDAREARAIDEALLASARRGVVTVLAAGHRAFAERNPLLWLPGVLPVTGTDRRGVPLYDIRWGVAMARRGLSAPGADVPGSVLPDGNQLRSGSSFAAGFVTAALALLCDAVPGATPGTAALGLLAFTERRPAAFSSALPRPLDGDRSLADLIRLTGDYYVH